MWPGRWYLYFYYSLGLIFQEFDSLGASRDAHISGMAEKQKSSSSFFDVCQCETEITHLEDICLDLRTLGVEIWCLSLLLRTFRNPVRNEKCCVRDRQWKCLCVSDIPHSKSAKNALFGSSNIQLLKISSQDSWSGSRNRGGQALMT